MQGGCPKSHLLAFGTVKSGGKPLKIGLFVGLYPNFSCKNTPKVGD